MQNVFITGTILLREARTRRERKRMRENKKERMRERMRENEKERMRERERIVGR